jgi:hypothetical protein
MRFPLLGILKQGFQLHQGDAANQFLGFHLTLSNYDRVEGLLRASVS